MNVSECEKTQFAITIKTGSMVLIPTIEVLCDSSLVPRLPSFIWRLREVKWKTWEAKSHDKASCDQHGNERGRQ